MEKTYKQYGIIGDAHLSTLLYMECSLDGSINFFESEIKEAVGCLLMLQNHLLRGDYKVLYLEGGTGYGVDIPQDVKVVHLDKDSKSYQSILRMMIHPVVNLFNPYMWYLQRKREKYWMEMILQEPGLVFVGSWHARRIKKKLDKLGIDAEVLYQPA